MACCALCSGMVAAFLYLCIILRVNPYLREDDDRLHKLAQVELILFLLAGNIFFNDPITGK